MHRGFLTSACCGSLCLAQRRALASSVLPKVGSLLQPLTSHNLRAPCRMSDLKPTNTRSKSPALAHAGSLQHAHDT